MNNIFRLNVIHGQKNDWLFLRGSKPSKETTLSRDRNRKMSLKLKPTTLLRYKLQHKFFPVNFAKLRVYNN